MVYYPRLHRHFLYVTVCIGNLVAFSSGILIGWSSPVNAKLTNKDKIDENPLGAVITSDQESWISSILVLGVVLGTIMGGFLSNRLGRKKTLFFCSGAPFLASYLMFAFSRTIILYYAARLIGGFGSGTMLSVFPHFLSEISEDSIRGTVSSSMNVFLGFGTLYSYVVGPYLSIMWFNISCAVWPALFLVLFFTVVPENPYYPITSNNLSGLTKSMKILRSDSESSILKEIEFVKYSVEQDKKNIGSFTDVFNPKASVKASIITITLLAFQQLSGIFVVLFNTQTIFSATGSEISAEISTIIVGVVQFIASFITPLAVDRLGRKPLLLISAIGMSISLVPLGLYFYLNDSGHDVFSISWLPIICLIAYIIFYNVGFGILPWTVMAEVLPAKIKTPASTVSACFSALLSFALTYSFSSINSAINMSGTFWLFSSFCAVAAVFVMIYMVETKGKSFQEIQDILAK